MTRVQALRALLWGGLAAGALYLASVHWWWTTPMLALGDRIVAVRDEERDLRMEVAQIPALRERLAALDARDAGNPGFLLATTAALGAAELIQRLETDVRAAHPNPIACEIIARTPMETAATEPFPRVTVQVRLRCGVGELGHVLQALETRQPQLFVDNLDIRALGGFVGAGQGATDSRVEVVFDLSGYLRSAAEADSDA